MGLTEKEIENTMPTYRVNLAAIVRTNQFVEAETRDGALNEALKITDRDVNQMVDWDLESAIRPEYYDDYLDAVELVED